MKQKKNMTPKKALALGILLDATGVALITKSQLGVTPISALPYIFNKIFPFLTYGTWFYAFQICLMLALFLVTCKLKKDYVMAFITGFCFSLALDVATFLFRSLPCSLLYSVLYFFAGTLLLMIGVGFLMNSGLPIMPPDLFPKEISAFFHIPYRKFKTVFDVVCVSITLILSLLFTGSVIGVGTGTLISACVNGFGISFFRNLQNEQWNFVRT